MLLQQKNRLLHLLLHFSLLIMTNRMKSKPTLTPLHQLLTSLNQFCKTSHNAIIAKIPFCNSSIKGSDPPQLVNNVWFINILYIIHLNMKPNLLVNYKFREILILFAHQTKWFNFFSSKSKYHTFKNKFTLNGDPNH